MDIQTLFENGRSMTIQFELSKLLKNKVSRCIIKGISQKNKLLGCQIEKISAVKSQHDVSELKKFASVHKKELGVELYECLLSEIKEISDDYRWINSKEGLVIQKIEDWIINVRKIAIKNFPNIPIYIGRSNWEPRKIIIGICVKDTILRNCIEEYFQSLSPPSLVVFPIKENMFD